VSARREVDYVIDLRGVQSVAMPERGIPRYLVNLTDALAERDDIGSLIGIVDPDGPLPRLSSAFGRRGGFGSSGSEPVGLALAGMRSAIHHIGSPFELQLRRPELEPQWLRARAPITAVSLFDVIPALQPETFPPWARTLWRARVEVLRSADVVLCISEHTARDGIRHLDLDPARVAVVGTGVPAALPGPATPPASLPAVRRPFVMYTGGSDHPRKNIPALIRAFARVSPAARAGVQLVIATRVSDAARRELTAVARRAGVGRDLVITGFVPDGDLAALYRSCACMVYPSLYEGFGLPIAEAMSHGAPVIGSSTTSCGEILEHPSARFDPADEGEIAAVLGRVLASEPLREELRRYGLARSRDFTWDAVAERTLAACRAALPAGRPRAARHSRACVFVAPGAPGPLRPQEAFATAGEAARELDGDVLLLTDGERPAARGAPLLVTALEAMPVCLVYDEISARIAAAALPRAAGVAVVWELDSLLTPDARGPGLPAASPHLLAALHHAGRVVVASQLDAWRVTALAGRSLTAPPTVAPMPLVVPAAGALPTGDVLSIALLRPERLGAIGERELERLEQLVRVAGALDGAVQLELVACLGASADAVAAAAAGAGVGFVVSHPDDAALRRGAGADVHADVDGASHSASLFSDAVARSAGRPVVVAGSAASEADLSRVPAVAEVDGVGTRQREAAAELARTLLALAADIDPRRRRGRAGVAASLIA
jgi:glycosyltransferase involved in cell wall biosynthesis